jgi:hypothetical protein
VESWLLGDPAGLGAFLGLRRVFSVIAPEELADPKQELLKLAMSSPRRDLRDALASKEAAGGRLYQGPDYNATLAKFVMNGWSLEEARRKCRSFDRLFLALSRIEIESGSGGVR